jgi:purine nucleosidase
MVAPSPSPSEAVAPVDVILDVDTGTDDAGALLLAATHPRYRLEAVVASWGNCSSEQAAHNASLVLEAAGSNAPVHQGAVGPSGPAPFTDPADEVMGRDGLCGLAGVVHGRTAVHQEPGAEMIVRRANDAPGRFTIVSLAPLTTLASALELDPGLPGKVAGLIVMGGAISVGGNVTPAAESNIAHDPHAAQAVVAAFGAPGAMPGGRLPQLVPLDVTRQAALTRRELDALAASSSSLPGAGLVHLVFSAAWETGLLETGKHDVWPAHDLLAAWCVHQPSVCRWEAMPLAVDTSGGAGWGATIGDRSVSRKLAWDHWRGVGGDEGSLARLSANRWSVAVAVDVAGYLGGLRWWLKSAGPNQEARSGSSEDPVLAAQGTRAGP